MNETTEIVPTAFARPLVSYIALLLYRVSPGSDSWTHKFVQGLNGNHPKCPSARPRQVALAMIRVAEQRGDMQIVEHLVAIAGRQELSWSSLAEVGRTLAQMQIDDWALTIDNIISDCQRAQNEIKWLESVRREAVLRHCDLCWKSAIWFRRGAALCARHIPPTAREDGRSAEYKAALRMRKAFEKNLHWETPARRASHSTGTISISREIVVPISGDQKNDWERTYFQRINQEA